MSRRSAPLAAAIMFITAGVAGAAPTPPVPAPGVALAPPQAQTAGYATPTVIIVRGQSLTFYNSDTTAHTLTSAATRLVRKGRRTYRVPIFDSGFATPSGSKAVKGVESLKPGTYAFLCYPHPSMKGELRVETSPA